MKQWSADFVDEHGTSSLGWIFSARVLINFLVLLRCPCSPLGHHGVMVDLAGSTDGTFLVRSWCASFDAFESVLNILQHFLTREEVGICG